MILATFLFFICPYFPPVPFDLAVPPLCVHYANCHQKESYGFAAWYTVLITLHCVNSRQFYLPSAVCLYIMRPYRMRQKILTQVDVYTNYFKQVSLHIQPRI